MKKKLLNNKQREIFNYMFRPYLFFLIMVGIIAIMGYNFGTLSSDEINGFIKAVVISFLANYGNLTFIELKNTNKE